MRTFIVLAVVVGILVSPAVVAAAPAQAACAIVSGTFLGQAVPTETGFDVYNIEITGPLAGHPVGEQLVWVTIQKVTPDGVVHFTGIHIIADSAFGPMTTYDKGSIAPNGRVHNTVTIVEGASGTITVHGTVDLTQGIVDIAYRGRVCDDE
jgi:hypothetical protein